MAKNRKRQAPAISKHHLTHRWMKEVERRKESAKRKALAKLRESRAFRDGSIETEAPTYRSRALRLLADQCTELVTPESERAGIILTPKTFSIIDNVVESLRPIFRAARAALTLRRVRITVDQRPTTGMDLAADSLLAIVLKEVRNENHGYRRSTIKGYYPRDAKLRQEMDEIGTVRVLFSAEGENIQISLKEDVKVYRHRQVGVEATRTIDAVDPVQAATKNFADHVNRCLATIGKQLTDAARAELCKYVGEILTNAQEHPGITDWTIIGYFDTKSQMFEVAIINFGRTIGQSFLDLDKNSYTWKQVGGYVNRMQRNAKARQEFTAESLVTVAALQGLISSKNLTHTDTRGQGTVAMIEFFQDFAGAASTQMVLLSGSTFIRFDPKYRMSTSGARSYIIAFNRENSLVQPPDRKVVQSMKNVFFPGTIIAIRFPLPPGAATSSKVEELCPTK